MEVKHLNPDNLKRLGKLQKLQEQKIMILM